MSGLVNTADWEGVMIPVDDFFIGLHHVPGWRCLKCRKSFGTEGPPPEHECKATDQHTGNASE